LTGWTVGGVDAIVEVGVVGVVEAVGLPPELEDEAPALELGVEPTVALPVAGVGETIAMVLEPDVLLPVDEDVEEALADFELGLELSCDTLAANGLRAMRASSTLVGASDGFAVVEVRPVVEVVEVDALLAAGGAGSTGALVADALLSSSTGTATTAAISAATTIHSLRSSRSRRSELIPGLRRSRADRAKR
jgi:hypothetical protein